MNNFTIHNQQQSIQVPNNIQERALSIVSQADNFNIDQLSRIRDQLNLLSGMLHHALTELDLQLDPNQYWQLLEYLDTLLLWNKTYNLTAITDPIEAMIKHIIDCLSIVPIINDQDYLLNELLDIGAGAGLPSVVIGICHPTRICRPLDSNQKKIRFIRQVASELGLSNIKPIATRIENFDGQFKLITSRAFASLSDFVNLATPYLHSDGKLIAMKGKIPLDEISSLSKEWKVNTIPLVVPYLSDSRHLIILSK